MEFFAVAEVRTTPEELRAMTVIDRLPDFCREVDAVEDPVGPEADRLRAVYFGQWGRFHLRRDEILGGVRFFVPDCPNALAWTMTTGFPPRPEAVVVHLTINRTDHDPEFIDAATGLLHALKIGLEALLGGQAAAVPDRPPLLGDLRGKA